MTPSMLFWYSAEPVNLPEYMEEKVLAEIQLYKQYSKKTRCAVRGMESVRRARQKIVDMVIDIGRKQERNAGGAEILKD
jgi:hypothetical protein